MSQSRQQQKRRTACWAGRVVSVEMSEFESEERAPLRARSMTHKQVACGGWNHAGGYSLKKSRGQIQAALVSPMDCSFERY